MRPRITKAPIYGPTTSGRIALLISAVAAADPGPPTVTLKGRKGTLWCPAFGRDGKSLASGAKDGTLLVWDLATRKPLVTIPGHAPT